jgi:DNA polymerase-3 subunit epsilon
MRQRILNHLKYDEQQIPALEFMVASARDNLVDLLAQHGILRGQANSVLALAFEVLGPCREKQELLVARLALLRLAGMMNRDGAVEQEFEERWKKAEEGVARRYRQSSDGLQGKSQAEPIGDRSERLRKVWKKLVGLYHPDRHHKDSEKRKKYERLMTAINRAKDDGDLDTLEKIAEDPEGFAREHGWSLGSDSGPTREDKDRMQELLELLVCLHSEIVKVEQEISDFLLSDDYALYELWKQSRRRFRKSIEAMRKALIADIKRLEARDRGI